LIIKQPRINQKQPKNNLKTTKKADNIMARDSFIFYASFYEAMKCLADNDYIAVSKAVNEYALYGNEIELSGIANGFFQLIKPQIDANNRRRENGLKGGAPSGNRNARKQPNAPEFDFKNNQELTEKQPKNNQKQPNVNVNVNVNDNKKENIKKKDVADATTPLPETVDFKKSDSTENPASPEKEKGCAEKEKAKAKTIEERAIDFWNELERYKGSYGCEMLQAFYTYWTEYNEGGRKMRYEMEKTFSLPRRLETWAKNDEKWNKKSSVQTNRSVNDIWKR